MKILITSILLIITYGGLSQPGKRLNGMVIDSLSHLPVASATIHVTASDTLKTKTFKSDEKGRFTIEPIANSIILRISSVGYQSKIITIARRKNQSKPDSAYVVIYLLPESKVLKDVTVQSKKQVVKQEIDRMVYDVQADADSKALTVLELMGKVPLLSLDGEENILLKGSGNYKIFINGKPSALMAQNPKEALRAMPANTVQRIEVITVPPAKYDAEGLAGIINIVLVKKVIDGYNGTAGLGYNNTVGMNENVTLTAKAGKFGAAARTYIYQDFRMPVQKENSIQQLLPASFYLDQLGTYSFVGYYQSGSAELSYEADSLNLLTMDMNLYSSIYHDRTSMTQATYNDQGYLASSFQSLNINPQHESGLDMNVNYQHGSKKNKDRLLTISYQLHQFPNRHTNQIIFESKIDYSQENYNQYNENGTVENTFQVDYAFAGKKFSSEMGAKAILRHNYSDFTTFVFDPITSSYIPDLSQNDRFTYNQGVYSMYNSWHLKWKALEIKTGVRMEATDANARFITTSSGFHKDYLNLIPVISLLKKFKNAILNAGFTQRILRPGIYQLNPFVDRSNPQFISSGNPSLKPVINSNFEFSYSYFRKASITLTLSYTFANNDIQQVTSFIDSTSYTNYQNIGKSKIAGLNGSISYPFSDKLSFTLNSQLTYLWIQGTLNTDFYSNKGLKGYAYCNVSYNIGRGFRAAITATYVSADIRLQGSTNAYIFSSYRLSKQFFSKKLLLSAAVSNPHKQYQYTVATTHTATFDKIVKNQRYYRMFNLNLNYNFGELKSEIKKSKKSITNDDSINKEN